MVNLIMKKLFTILLLISIPVFADDSSFEIKDINDLKIYLDGKFKNLEEKIDGNTKAIEEINKTLNGNPHDGLKHQIARIDQSVTNLFWFFGICFAIPCGLLSVIEILKFRKNEK